MAKDLAMAQSNLALSERGHLGVVGNHNDGVALGMKILKEFGDDRLVGGVKIAGRLVS
jgi:hypothetical protein